MEIKFSSIGVIHSPFTDLSEMPIQPTGESSAPGTAEIFPEFLEGLKDLDGFSHVILIYQFHKVKQKKLMVTPFLDSEPHGVFATRAPVRPNSIGLSVVSLERIEGAELFFGNLDILDGTPLLDIKPYIPVFDQPEEVRMGWLEKNQQSVREMKSDRRFAG
ncbi:MAG: tRNA (N6-threonylcarbamoyladenosine(37)-N6)-methyltransferase TrmO [Anaerolineaceae bacterium]|nr:tRNA (N6-threonylcarbamoyladenosine(37)-N6)-methyltransferase TrmO [Anaerolineaceae bacterium]